VSPSSTTLTRSRYWHTLIQTSWISHTRGATSCLASIRTLIFVEGFLTCLEQGNLYSLRVRSIPPCQVSAPWCFTVVVVESMAGVPTLEWDESKRKSIAYFVQAVTDRVAFPYWIIDALRHFKKTIKLSMWDQSTKMVIDKKTQNWTKTKKHNLQIAPCLMMFHLCLAARNLDSLLHLVTWCHNSLLYQSVLPLPH
jgi:hypothetical protein